MATQDIDPRRFASWEDAFQHPISTVNLLEKQLRSHADENRQKLRGLVGASYRTLLETAETIVQMDGGIRDVEQILAHTGRCSNPQAIVERSKGQIWVAAHVNSPPRDEYETAAELRLLQCCITVIAKGLKTVGSPLAIAKVMVISRLLHKSITQRPKIPKLVDTIRSGLANLRARLLKRLEVSLAKPDIEIPLLLEALSAYALITSSTPTDVLRHLHQCRNRAISRCLKRRNNIGNDVSIALKLYLRTIKDSQGLFPQQLATALSRMKSQPLMSQRDVRQMGDLRLEHLGDWLSGDLRNYTPWLQHDELLQASAKTYTQKWTTDALGNLMNELSQTLADVKDLQSLLALRRQSLESWPWFEKTPAFFDKVSGAEELRKVFNNHFQRLIRTNVAQLHKIIHIIVQTLKDNTGLSSGGSTSLWSICPPRSDRVNSIPRLEDSVVEAYKGHIQATQEIRHTYQQWQAELTDIQLVVKSMQDDLWDDAFSDEEEDAFHLDDRRAMLSEDDPRHLEKVFRDAVEEAQTRFQVAFGEVVSETLASPEPNFEQATFLLRVLADIRRDTGLDGGLQNNIEVSSDILSSLWSLVATRIVAEPLACLQQRILRHNGKTAPGGLCDGSHDLPTQPTSFVFRFLVDLTTHMTELGPDLWAASATLPLKKLATDGATNAVAKAMDAVSKTVVLNGFTKTNGDHKAVDDLDDHGDPQHGVEVIWKESKLRQLLFDVLFLQKALHAPQAVEGGGLCVMARDLQDKLKIEEQLLRRLQTSVTDYWKKTYLLFAILS